MSSIQQEPPRVCFGTDRVIISFINTANDKIEKAIQKIVLEGIDITFYSNEQYCSVVIVRDMLACHVEDMYTFVDFAKAIIVSNLQSTSHLNYIGAVQKCTAPIYKLTMFFICN